MQDLSLNRRTVVSGVFAAGVTATVSPLAALAHPMEKSMTSPRKVMWAAAMMTRPLAERLEALATSGFTAMSVFPADMRRWNNEGISNADISRQVRSSGVKVIALDPFTGWVPGWSVEGLDQDTKDFIDFSEDDIWRMSDALDAERINMVQSVGDDYALEPYAEALGGFAERAKSHGRGVALEFMPISKIPDLKTGWELVQAAGDDVRMVFDTWHFWRSDPDHDLLATIPGQRIAEVQLADGRSEITGNLMVDLMQYRTIPGEGDFDLVKTIRVLDQIGGMRSYGPETFSDAMNELSARQAIRRNEEGITQLVIQARRAAS